MYLLLVTQIQMDSWLEFWKSELTLRLLHINIVVSDIFDDSELLQCTVQFILDVLL